MISLLSNSRRRKEDLPVFKQVKAGKTQLNGLQGGHCVGGKNKFDWINDEDEVEEVEEDKEVVEFEKGNKDSKIKDLLILFP